MSKISVQLVSWNGAKYIPYLLDSLRAQTYTDWELLMWDNNSTDTTAQLLKEGAQNFPVPVKLTEHSANLGFAPAHNQLYAQNTSEYILLLNQDMYLSSTCLAELAAGMDSHPDAGAVTPRLMRWDFAKVQTIGLQKSLSEYIDAIGLRVFRNRRVIEDYTKQLWSSVQKNLPAGELEVFGASGAFPLYRRAALQKIAFADGSFFDETYISYKEDVDVAYRLQTAGYKAYVLLNSVAHHDRTGAGPEQLTDQAAASNKKVQSPYVRYHSYKNHLRTVYKNEYWQNFALDFPWIFWYEFKKFVFFLLFEPKILAGLFEIWKNRADLKMKREKIKSIRKIDWKILRKWWCK